MDRRTFQTSIYNAWDKVQRINLAETFSNGGSLDVDDDFRDLVLNGESRYEDIFLLGLRKSHYNFLTSDHSYFQFTWSNEDDVRYAFYPNPYIGSSSQHLDQYKKWYELFTADLITLDDYLKLVDDVRGQGRKPVLRYENAPSQYKNVAHPCSHLHIGLHGEDRWPVRRILSPLAFALIILRNYYSNNWNTYGEINSTSGLNILDEEFISERQSCKLVASEYFSDTEARLFHFN
ncbi:MAG: DUF2290 domain-containing protein [Undibacterium umbellatum]|uniref:DUF2290 domain-containing protein n=1 Tax=Undibacterium umbellatum TaxID=2762300 RepID=UPI003BB7C915